MDIHLNSDFSSSPCVADDMYVLSTSNKRVSVELVGMDKIQDKLSRFEELKAVSLPYLGVSSLGEPCKISSTMPSKVIFLFSHDTISVLTFLNILYFWNLICFQFFRIILSLQNLLRSQFMLQLLVPAIL